MNKFLKKSLIISASALMFLSVGAGMSNVNAKGRISAKTQITRLKNRRSNLKKRVSHENLTIRKINQQIKQLERREGNYRWRKGLPKVFSKKAYWVGTFQYQKHSPRNSRYARNWMPLDRKDGVTFNPIYYNAFHHVTGAGAGSSYGNVNPHFESLGNGWYRLTSGSENKNSLNEELNNTFIDGNAGSVELIHMHGRNHFSMWRYKTNDNKPYYTGKKVYMGYFTRYNTLRAANHVLGVKEQDF